MMATFDRLLVGPLRNDLILTLQVAAVAANAGRALLGVELDDWAKAAAELAGQPEARRAWRGGVILRATVTLALWTDHRGKRHFRVRGYDSGSHPHHAGQNAPPPFWDIYPDQCYCRAVPGPGGDFRREWCVVCRCDVVGEPLKVGWTGECCAACHDRALDGEEMPAGHVPTAHLARTLAGDRHRTGRRLLAFSPDGGLLAAAACGGTSYVRLFRLGSDELQEVIQTERTTRLLAFAPDGRLLGTTADNHRFVVTDLTPDRNDFDHREQFDVACMAFSPHGLALAVGGGNGVQVWERRERAGGWELRHAVAGQATALAFSPGSHLLAVGGAGGALRLIDAVGGTVVAEATVGPRGEPMPVRQMAFVADDTVGAAGRLLCLLASDRSETGQPCVCAVRVVGHSFQPLVEWPLRGCYQAALSGDGRWVAWVSGGEPLVRLTDLTTGAELGRVGWRTGVAVAALALHHAAGLLAVVDELGDGKLIPWRLLLAP